MCFYTSLTNDIIYLRSFGDCCSDLKNTFVLKNDPKICQYLEDGDYRYPIIISYDKQFNIVKGEIFPKDHYGCDRIMHGDQFSLGRENTCTVTSIDPIYIASYSLKINNINNKTINQDIIIKEYSDDCCLDDHVINEIKLENNDKICQKIKTSFFDGYTRISKGIYDDKPNMKICNDAKCNECKIINSIGSENECFGIMDNNKWFALKYYIKESYTNVEDTVNDRKINIAIIVVFSLMGALIVLLSILLIFACKRRRDRGYVDI